MNILGTHDTTRILTELGSGLSPASKDEMSQAKLSKEELCTGIKLLKLAVVLQMTLPGVPCIFYGDEVGLEGWKDPFNRICFPWEHENVEILSHYRYISELRRNSKVFAEGSYKCLIHDKEVFVFQRYNSEEKIIIGINLSETTITLKLHENMKEYGSINVGSTFDLKKGSYIILQNKTIQ
jgi:glycosidase